MVYLTGKGSSCTIADKKERVIRCVVVAAEGLPKTDFLTGLADPYVKIHLTSVQAQAGGAQDLPVVHSFRTAHVRASLTPEWNESFILTPHNLEDRLDLEVWDYDVVDEDDIMGSVSCHISDIIHHCDGVERWYALRGPKKQHAGRLALRLEVSEPHEKYLTAVTQAPVARGGNQPPAAAGAATGGVQKAQAMIFRRMSFQAAARMRRPRLKDLPECLVPDPALLRAIFQRCFASRLTVPQIRYFFMLWEKFESEVIGESSPEHKERFASVRTMVWRAVNSVNAKHPRGLIGLPEVSEKILRASSNCREVQGLHSCPLILSI